MVDEKSKWFFLLLFLSIGISVGYAYYRFVYARNYSVEMHVPCDPAANTCFVLVCDPEAEECSGDPIQDTTFHSVLDKMAYAIPACDPKEDACMASLVCNDGEKNCMMSYCEESALEDGERCSDESDIIPTQESLSGEADVMSADTENAEPTTAETSPSDTVPADASSMTTPMPGAPVPAASNTEASTAAAPTLLP